MALWVCSGCSTRYAPGSPACPHCGSAERVEEGGGGSRLPFLDVACPTQGCRAAGVVRRVYLRVAALGVVEMPHLLLCQACGMAMPASRSWVDEEENVPKITRHGGASNAAAEQPPAVEEAAAAVVDEGGEESSPGSSSETSAEKPPTSPETSEASLPKRARTTGSRSGKGRTGSSTARSTDTSTEADAS
jgi:hypothetical protein